MTTIYLLCADRVIMQPIVLKSAVYALSSVGAQNSLHFSSRQEAGVKEIVLSIVIMLVAWATGGYITATYRRWRNRELLALKNNPVFDPHLQLSDDLIVDYWLLSSADEINEEHLVLAWFADWFCHGLIAVEERGTLGSSKLHFSAAKEFTSDFEAELYNMIYEAASINGMTLSEFVAWSNTNSRVIWKFVDRMNKRLEEQAIAQGYARRSILPVISKSRYSERGKKRLRELFMFRTFTAEYLLHFSRDENKRDHWFASIVYGELLTVLNENWQAYYDAYPANRDELSSFSLHLEIVEQHARTLSNYIIAERAEMKLKRPDQYQLPEITRRVLSK